METAESSKDVGEAKKGENKKPDIVWFVEFSKTLRNCIGLHDLKTFDNSIKEFIRLLREEVSNSVNKRLRVRSFFMSKELQNCLFFYADLYSNVGEMMDQSIYTTRMMEILPLFLDLEMLSFGTRIYRTDDVAGKIITILNIFLNQNQMHVSEILLHITTHWNPNRIDKSNDLLVLLFKKLLNNKINPTSDIEYVQYVLLYRLWKIVERDIDERMEINDHCLARLQVPKDIRIGRSLVQLFPPSTPIKSIKRMLIIEIDVFAIIQNFLRYVCNLRKESLEGLDILSYDILSPIITESYPAVLDETSFDDCINNFVEDLRFSSEDTMADIMQSIVSNSAPEPRSIAGELRNQQRQKKQQHKQAAIMRRRHSARPSTTENSQANEVICLDSDDEKDIPVASISAPPDSLLNAPLNVSLRKYVLDILNDTTSTFIRDTKEKLGILDSPPVRRSSEAAICIDLQSDEETENDNARNSQPAETSTKPSTVSEPPKSSSSIETPMECSEQTSTNSSCQTSDSPVKTGPVSDVPASESTDNLSVTKAVDSENQSMEVSDETITTEDRTSQVAQVTEKVQSVTVQEPKPESNSSTVNTTTTPAPVEEAAPVAATITASLTIDTQLEQLSTVTTDVEADSSSQTTPKPAPSTESGKNVITTPELINTCMSMLAKDPTSKTTALVTPTQSSRLPQQSLLVSLNYEPDLRLNEPSHSDVHSHETLSDAAPLPNAEASATIVQDFPSVPDYSNTVKSTSEEFSSTAYDSRGGTISENSATSSTNIDSSTPKIDDSNTSLPKILECYSLNKSDTTMNSESLSLLDLQDDVSLNVSPSPKTYIDRGKDSISAKKSWRENRMLSDKRNKSLSPVKLPSACVSFSECDSSENQTNTVSTSSAPGGRRRRNSFMTPAQLKYMSSETDSVTSDDMEIDHTITPRLDISADISDGGGGGSKHTSGSMKVLMRSERGGIRFQDAPPRTIEYNDLSPISPTPESSPNDVSEITRKHYAGNKYRQRVIPKNKCSSIVDSDDITSPNFEEFALDDKKEVIRHFAESRAMKSSRKSQNIVSAPSASTSHYMVASCGAPEPPGVKNKHVPVANVIPQYKSVHFPSDVIGGAGAAGSSAHHKVRLHKEEKESDIQFRLNFYKPDANASANSPAGNAGSAARNLNRYAPVCNRRDMNQSKSAITQHLQSTSTSSGNTPPSPILPSGRVHSSQQQQQQQQQQTSTVLAGPSSAFCNKYSTFAGRCLSGEFMSRASLRRIAVQTVLDENSSRSRINTTVGNYRFGPNAAESASPERLYANTDYHAQQQSSRSRSKSRRNSVQTNAKKRSKSQTKTQRSRSLQKSPVRSKSETRYGPPPAQISSRSSTRNSNRSRNNVAASSLKEKQRMFLYIAPVCNGQGQGKVSFYVENPEVNYSELYNVGNTHNPFVELDDIMSNLPGNVRVRPPPVSRKKNADGKFLAKMPPDKKERKPRGRKPKNKPNKQPEEVVATSVETVSEAQQQQPVIGTTEWLTPAQPVAKNPDTITKRLDFDGKQQQQSTATPKQKASQLLRKRPMEKVDIDTSKASSDHKNKRSMVKNFAPIFDDAERDLYGEDDSDADLFNSSDREGSLDLEVDEETRSLTDTPPAKHVVGDDTDHSARHDFEKEAIKRSSRAQDLKLTQDDMINHAATEKKDVLVKLRKRINRANSLPVFAKPVKHIVGDEIVNDGVKSDGPEKLKNISVVSVEIITVPVPEDEEASPPEQITDSTEKNAEVAATNDSLENPNSDEIPMNASDYYQMLKIIHTQDHAMSLIDLQRNVDVPHETVKSKGELKIFDVDEKIGGLEDTSEETSSKNDSSKSGVEVSDDTKVIVNTEANSTTTLAMSSEPIPEKSENETISESKTEANKTQEEKSLRQVADLKSAAEILGIWRTTDKIERKNSPRSSVNIDVKTLESPKRSESTKASTKIIDLPVEKLSYAAARKIPKSIAELSIPDDKKDIFRIPQSSNADMYDKFLTKESQKGTSTIVNELKSSNAEAIVKPRDIFDVSKPITPISSKKENTEMDPPKLVADITDTSLITETLINTSADSNLDDSKSINDNSITSNSESGTPTLYTISKLIPDETESPIKKREKLKTTPSKNDKIHNKRDIFAVSTPKTDSKCKMPRADLFDVQTNKDSNKDQKESHQNSVTEEAFAPKAFKTPGQLKFIPADSSGDLNNYQYTANNLSDSAPKTSSEITNASDHNSNNGKAKRDVVSQGKTHTTKIDLFDAQTKKENTFNKILYVVRGSAEKDINLKRDSNNSLKNDDIKEKVMKGLGKVIEVIKADSSNDKKLNDNKAVANKTTANEPEIVTADAKIKQKIVNQKSSKTVKTEKSLSGDNEISSTVKKSGPLDSKEKNSVIVSAKTRVNIKKITDKNTSKLTVTNKQNHTNSQDNLKISETNSIKEPSETSNKSEMSSADINDKKQGIMNKNKLKHKDKDVIKVEKSQSPLELAHTKSKASANENTARSPKTEEILVKEKSTKGKRIIKASDTNVPNVNTIAGTKDKKSTKSVHTDSTTKGNEIPNTNTSDIPNSSKSKLGASASKGDSGDQKTSLPTKSSTSKSLVGSTKTGPSIKTPGHLKYIPPLANDVNDNPDARPWRNTVYCLPNKIINKKNELKNAENKILAKISSPSQETVSDDMTRKIKGKSEEEKIDLKHASLEKDIFNEDDTNMKIDVKKDNCEVVPVQQGDSQNKLTAENIPATDKTADIAGHVHDNNLPGLLKDNTPCINTKTKKAARRNNKNKVVDIQSSAETEKESLNFSSTSISSSNLDDSKIEERDSSLNVSKQSLVSENEISEVQKISKNVAKRRRPFTKIYLSKEYSSSSKKKYLPKLPKLSVNKDMSIFVDKLSEEYVNQMVHREKDKESPKVQPAKRRKTNVTEKKPRTTKKTISQPLENNKIVIKKSPGKKVRALADGLVTLPKTKTAAKKESVLSDKTNKNKRRLGMAVVLNSAAKRRKVIHEHVVGTLTSDVTSPKPKTSRNGANKTIETKSLQASTPKAQKAKKDTKTKTDVLIPNNDATELMYPSDDSLDSHYFKSNFSPNTTDDRDFRDDSSPEPLIVEIEEVHMSPDVDNFTLNPTISSEYGVDILKQQFFS